jgi:hypothetical protein
MSTSARSLDRSLTPEQIAEIEELESLHRDEPKGPLVEARGYAEDSLISAVRFPRVGRPSEAKGTLGGWVENCRAWSREFDGATRELGPFVVTVAGRQYADGGVERHARVVGQDSQALSVDDLRRVVSLVSGAADEIERLQG